MIEARGFVVFLTMRLDLIACRDAGDQMTRKTSNHRGLSSLLAFTVSAVVWLIGSALAAPQAQPPAAKKTSDTVFKNIQVMKGVPVDDFMGTMGIMCAALGFDGSVAHTTAGPGKRDWAAAPPKTVGAR